MLANMPSRDRISAERAGGNIFLRGAFQPVRDGCAYDPEVNGGPNTERAKLRDIADQAHVRTAGSTQSAISACHGDLDERKGRRLLIPWRQSRYRRSGRRKKRSTAGKGYLRG